MGRAMRLLDKGHDSISPKKCMIQLFIHLVKVFISS